MDFLWKEVLSKWNKTSDERFKFKLLWISSVFLDLSKEEEKKSKSLMFYEFVASSVAIAMAIQQIQ